MLDLGGREGTLQAKRRYEIIAEGYPVNVRICDFVRIHIAGGAAEFGRIGQERELSELFFQTDLIDLELFSETGRGCRLTMGLREHRNIFPLLCHA